MLIWFSFDVKTILITYCIYAGLMFFVWQLGNIWLFSFIFVSFLWNVSLKITAYPYVLQVHDILAS